MKQVFVKQNNKAIGVQHFPLEKNAQDYKIWR